MQTQNYLIRSALCLLLPALLAFSSTSTLCAQELFFERIYEEGLAQASFVIGDKSTGTAIVIDPKRDMDTYLEIAKANKLKITHVTETHIHADFLTGTRELAAATGATILLSDEGGKDWQYDFPHQGLKDGDRFQIGKLEFEVVHTPGHTPESITFLLKDPKPGKPLIALTGDFIFVGDVGRPDLLEKSVGQAGTQEAGARQMYASIQKFAALPDETLIWPGHGAGSFCGKSLSSAPSSTLGQEKKENKAFHFANNEDGFVKYILDGQPEPPRYFATMKKLNRVQRPLLMEVPKYRKLSPDAFAKAQQKGMPVIDSRSKAKFEKGFLPGSLIVEGNKSFSTWMGSLVNYDKPFLLIADDAELDQITRKLMRIGMDNAYGYIAQPQDLSNNLQKVEVIDMEQFKDITKKDNVQILDVRRTGEFAAGHIAGADNIALASLDQNLSRIDKNKEVVIYCQTGVRAAIAYSILKMNGYQNVKSYVGGMKEWTDSGNEIVR